LARASTVDRDAAAAVAENARLRARGARAGAAPTRGAGPAAITDMDYNCGMQCPTFDNPIAYTIAVLAGGQSRRLGQDKAMLELGGLPLLDHVLAAAGAVGPRVVVIGRAANGLVAHGPDARAAADYLPDDIPGRGPLGGLATALRAAGDVLLLGCDMPLISAAVLRWLAAESDACPAADGVVPRRAGRLEPLCAVYRATCLPLAAARLAEGQGAMQAFIEAGAFEVVDLPDQFAPDLANVNTPDAWAAVARVWAERGAGAAQAHGGAALGSGAAQSSASPRPAYHRDPAGGPA
jgi:molybdopterin-guanine dinucleotide biosynthesis protein A